MAGNDVVKGSRRGMITENDIHLDDGRWVRIVAPTRIQERVTAAKCSEPEDLFVHCTMVIIISRSDSTI
jgi:hypothetical protein